MASITVELSKESIAEIVAQTVVELMPHIPTKATPVLDTREAAEYLHVSVATLLKLAAQERIPNFKIEKKIFFNLIELEKWMKAGGTKCTEKPSE